MLDKSIRDFCAVKVAALLEYTPAIRFAMKPLECLEDGVHQEALAR